MSRKKVVLSPREVSKANMMYFTNQRTITDVAKALKRSPPVIQRHLFKTKDEYWGWYEQAIAKGEL